MCADDFRCGDTLTLSDANHGTLAWVDVGTVNYYCDNCRHEDAANSNGSCYTRADYMDCDCCSIQGFLPPRFKCNHKHEFIFIVASAPEHVLREVRSITERYNGFYTAGDKDDTFNDRILRDAGFASQWRSAWLGKTEAAIQMANSFRPGLRVHLVVIRGGPACEWERGQIESNLVPSRREVQLQTFDTIGELAHWLELRC